MEEILNDPIKEAIAISLFSDARATPEELPAHEEDPRGWWANSYNEFEVGSKLWILSRDKIDEKSANRFRSYIADSLNWMVEDKIIENINIAMERLEHGFEAIIKMNNGERKYTIKTVGESFHVI